MDSGKRNVFIVLAIVAIVALAVIFSRSSQTRDAEGEKPWMKAVEKQLQLDEKEYEKDESFDLDEDSPEEYLDAMVKDGKLLTSRLTNCLGSITRATVLE